MPRIDVFASCLKSEVQRLKLHLEQIQSYREYLVNQHEAYKVFHTSTRAQMVIKKKPLIIDYTKGLKMGLITVDCMPNPRYIISLYM